MADLWSERARAARSPARGAGRAPGRARGRACRLEELPAALRRQRTELAQQLAETEARRSALGVGIAGAKPMLARGAGGARPDRRGPARGAPRRRRLEPGSSAPRPKRPLPRRPVRCPPRRAAAKRTSRRRRQATSWPSWRPSLRASGAARERLGPVNLRAIDEARELALRIETLRSEQAELRARSSVCGAPSRRSTARAASGCWRRSTRSRAISDALFVRLFGGGRAHLRADRPPTTRWPPGWSWRRARPARSCQRSRCCPAARRR